MAKILISPSPTQYGLAILGPQEHPPITVLHIQKQHHDLLETQLDV